MRNKRDAHTYAAALYPFITAAFTESTSVIEVIVRAFQDVPELARFLEHPSFSRDDKKKVFFSLFGNKLSSSLERLMELLIARHKLSLLPELPGALKALHLVRQNLREVRIRSAYALSGQQQAAVTGEIASVIREKIIPVFIVDPALIGGVRIEMQDWVLDYSLKGQLQAVSQYLHGAG